MPLTNDRIAELARELKDYQLQAKALNEKADKIKPRIIKAMQGARTKLVEAAGVRIVLTEQEVLEYNEPGLWDELKPTQRRLAFDEELNLNALNPEERRALMAAIREILTPGQRRRCTTRKLNIARLSAAVQSGKISTLLVDRHSEMVKRAPYTTITLK